MRATLRLDEDVYEKLRERAEQSGRPLEDVANESLRRVLVSGRTGPASRFRVRPRAMGTVASGGGYDDIPKLLDRIEGSDRR